MKLQEEKGQHELREAWREFIHAVEEALKLQLIVNWMAKQLNKYEKSRKKAKDS